MTNWRLLDTPDYNAVVYPRDMTETLDELRKLGKQIRTIDAKREALIARRKELALKAKAEGTSWNKQANALEMSEHGLIKATKGK